MFLLNKHVKITDLHKYAKVDSETNTKLQRLGVQPVFKFGNVYYYHRFDYESVCQSLDGLDIDKI